MSNQSTKTRNQILKAAWQLLESNQGNGVRMSDIAKQACVSRQALYLHFETRSDLLLATTLYLDEMKGIEERLAPSRAATDGVTRLTAFIDAWTSYIPEIYGVARALMILQETDSAAAEAWNGRMLAVRHGCAAAIHALDRDGQLSAAYTAEQATDMLWMLLSVRSWEQLTQNSKWTQSEYVSHIQSLAHQAFVQ